MHGKKFETGHARKVTVGLMDYLNNASRYTPEAISAAVEELKNRGKNFTREELDEITIKIRNSAEAFADPGDESRWLCLE